jgi:phosphate:Na+ symporter
MDPSWKTLLLGFGGLALFLFGMSQLGEGLRAASGPALQAQLRRFTRHRLAGFTLGTLTATLIHSSATTVLVVGLLHAGLLSLAAAIPVIAGANLGTTLAMQLIALDVRWLWAALAVIGGLLQALPGPPANRSIGRGIIGLSLLFLGMQLMSQAAYPFRTELAGWLTRPDNGAAALFAPLGGALLFTMIVQSSGATIGILFSLAQAGVFSTLDQAAPMVLGAQLGTCITALAAAAGASPSARRGAIAHLAFNLIVVAVAIAAYPWMIRAVESAAVPLHRHIALYHTLTMFAGGLLVVPWAATFARAIERLTPSRGGEQELSALDDHLLDHPDAAIAAAGRELGRVARMARRGFALNREMILTGRPVHRAIKRTEEAVDASYLALRDFLLRLAARITDPAQAARLPSLHLVLIYLERISDHNDNLADLNHDLRPHHTGDLDPQTRLVIESLYDGATPALDAIEAAWRATPPPADGASATIRAARNAYLPVSETAQARIIKNLADGSLPPRTGFLLNEYVSEVDRIVRHTKKIASATARVAPPPAQQ